MSGFKDHFSANAAGYSAHRPTYPPSLVDFLADVAPARDLVLDVGCGSGQLSVPLTRRFSRVVAVDASAGQIASATPHPRIAYRVALADVSGLDARSVDVVTVAQAAHWLDLPAFYQEVRRVARPDAVLALIAYGVLHVEDEAVEAVASRFYHDALAPYWPPARRHVEQGYASLPFPFARIISPSFSMAMSWTLADMIGYVAT